MKKNHITAAVCLAAALAVTVVTGLNFASLKDLGEIKPGDGVTGTRKFTYWRGKNREEKS